MVILSQRALEGIKAYKYKPGGYTKLDDLHTPFWNWLTNKLPMWLAPNLITLTGLFALIIGYVVMWIYSPNYTDDAPNWVYSLGAVAVVFYTNMDCIDGKQARRTGSSSPLGQLFDHGCDAIALHLMLGMAQTSVQQPMGFISSLALTLAMLPWICSQYEEYHTGHMIYGNGYFGVLEANYILAFVFALSGIFGPSFWSRIVFSAVPLPILGTMDITARHVFVVIDIVAAVNQTYGQLFRVFSSSVDRLPKEEQGYKELGLASKIRHLMWIAILLGFGGYWTARDQSKMSNPVEARFISLAFGIIFAMVATKLIMDHMCKEPFRPTLWAFIILILSTVNVITGTVNVFLASQAAAAFCLVFYLTNITGIINDICRFLKINCLTIKPQKKTQ